eukprot:scaffold31975_cov107-Isochrysis_galbana.AAC.2
MAASPPPFPAPRFCAAFSRFTRGASATSGWARAMCACAGARPRRTSPLWRPTAHRWSLWTSAPSTKTRRGCCSTSSLAARACARCGLTRASFPKCQGWTYARTRPPAAASGGDPSSGAD